MNINTEIYDRAVDRAAMVRLYERRVSGKVTLELDGHEVRLDKLIRDAEASPKGMKALQEAVDQELVKTYGSVFSTMKRSLLDSFAAQVSYAYQNLETAVGEIWRTQRPERRVAEEVVLRRPLHQDATLAQGWTNVSAGERIRLEALIRRGIAEGWSPSKIALEVRKGNVVNISRNQSQALVTTAITSVNAQADQSVYEANRQALHGWQYVAVLDSRTTPLCAHRDGHIYDSTDIVHLPPAHYRCRSTTVPVVKSWEDLAKLEGVAQVRKRNIAKLTDAQKAKYDGQTPLRESYNDWLKRQPTAVQLRHLGDYKRVDMLNTGELTVDKFTNDKGNSIGIKELRQMTNIETPSGDTRKFANAKDKLDAMQLGASTPEDLYEMRNTLVDYYLLQAGDLNGNLSLTNYRGVQLGNKRATRGKVIQSPPTEEQLRYNPLTGRYDDVRFYQPNNEVYAGAVRRINESEQLLQSDKDFINKVLGDLAMKMSMNERAVVGENLRAVITRYRTKPEVWGNTKAVLNGQMKFDVMNISDSIETQLRKDKDVLKKLMDDDYIDPVLGRTQLETLQKEFVDNIMARNKWEDTTAREIARELQPIFDTAIPLKIKRRLTDRDLQQFYLRFAHRLGMADSPDRDGLAVSLGRDLHNLAGYTGNRREWYATGLKILEKNAGNLFEVNAFGVQKRRMKSRLSGQYFGPYYDTTSYYIDIIDSRITNYAKLNRKVDMGLRVAVTDAAPQNRLLFREGYKTYFLDRGIKGMYDTRIPVTSTSSFSDFPVDMIDKDMVNAMNWAAQSRYKIDEDFYDFTQKLLYFKDDRGGAAKYDALNHYRDYITGRGDAYERFKSMEWLRKGNQSFSNHPFLDHRARVYDRGLISAQSGETFRPFLNTDVAKPLGREGYDAFTDQVGAFLGGQSDYFEGAFDGLTFIGRQKIAAKWRPTMIEFGERMMSAKPADIRWILESDIFARIDGEELGKFMRLAIETAKLDRHLKGTYNAASLDTLKDYMTGLAMEQDASSSGAQIIALTTRNKQLASLSNVIPTNQKRRLYDEIAAATYEDPRFKTLNERLGLSLKDLQKAAKGQNMVTFYGAGEKTGIFAVETKLAKSLGKQEGTLVVTSSERQRVLNEIDARIARLARYDPDGEADLRSLRNDVRDVFNKGQDPGDAIMEDLWFLDPQTKDIVEKLSKSYEKVVTPDDFKAIASIMSDHLSEQVPILKDFTKFFGRLAESYLANAKPKDADLDWKTIVELKVRGKRQQQRLNPLLAQVLGLPADVPVTEQLLQRITGWNPNSTLADFLLGTTVPGDRTVGKKLFKLDFGKAADVIPSLKKASKASEITFAYTDMNKVPKSWTRVPWVNFDGKTVEQNFTQTFEERLVYKDKDGNWVTNILMVPQKTAATWWEETFRKEGTINDIADAQKARTAFAVNGNHSNDAVIVKKFHLWGRKNGVSTSTVHDAFFTNIADMLEGRTALRGIYAETLDNNVIKMTLDEMRSRGLPKEIYDAYLQEAIEKGLIPVAGKSRVGGRLLTKEDILTKEDVLQAVPYDFQQNYGWYGVG